MAGFLKQLKNKTIDMAMNFTEVEVKVREATDPDEAWGPTGAQMNELAAATYSADDYVPLMSMLWKRVFKDMEVGANWRRIYKVPQALCCD